MSQTVVVIEAGRRAVRALVVDERATTRDEVARRLRRRGGAEVEALAPGKCLDLVGQKEFDIIIFGRVGHRHLRKQLTQLARQRNPQVRIAAVEEQVAARAREHIDSLLGAGGSQPHRVPDGEVAGYLGTDGGCPHDGVSNSAE